MATWRVGRKLGRTLYKDDQCVGMVDTPELAAVIVEAMNRCAPKCQSSHEGFPCQGWEGHTGCHRYDAPGISRAWGRASGAPPLGPMASKAVVTGTPYLVALFPLTCHCGVELRDLAACAAHECPATLRPRS